MPTIDSIDENQASVKACLMADSGDGKTCALASLVNAGYEMAVLDFDNKIRAIRPFLTDEAFSSGRLHFAELTDKLKTINDKIVPKGQPIATTKAMTLLNHWKIGEEDLGPVSSWGPNRILVVDTLTFQGDAAMRHVQALASASGDRIHPSHWGEAQRIQQGFLELLCSQAINCHVIINSHISYMGGKDPAPIASKDKYGNVAYQVTSDNIEPDAPMSAYPSALGRKLPPLVGRYFDSLLSIKIEGTNRRFLITSSRANISLKNPRPDKVPDKIPLGLTKDHKADPDQGLAQYFKLVLGHGPQTEEELSADD